MAVLIDSVQFTDNLGNSNPFYQGNAGDEITAVITARTRIRMSSVGNPLTLDPTTLQAQSTQSWLDAGFRPGQWVYIARWTSGGALLNSGWAFIDFVDDIICDFQTIPNWYSLSNSEILTIVAVVANGSLTSLPLDELDVLLNHSQNATPGSEFSQIDGEASRGRMTGIAALGVGGSVPGVLLGFQSGGFFLSIGIQRVMGIDQYLRYEITLTFVNPGMYDVDWFFSSTCLKAWISTEWAVTPGEPYNRLTGLYNLEADTGYFDEPFNTGISDSILVQGISEIDYCLPTTADIIVDGAITGLGIGSCYLPTDETYYKNQVENQSNLTMVIPTVPLVVSNFFSYLNPTNAQYNLEINSIVTLGSVTTINVTITPDANFQAFMDGRDPLDRRFMLWVRCGNINLLAFDNQLECAPPVAGPLIMEQDYGYLDHCENLIADTSYGDLTGFVADTEDDVAYVGRFLLNKDELYESFSVKFEAYDALNDVDFTLREIVFSFASVQISGDGRYLLNEVQTVNTTLPNTSQKREAILQLDPGLDSPTQYGVLIYAPWLLDWRYWLDQNNASVDFYPTQDKNWEQYDNLADWELRTELSLVQDGLAYQHSNVLIDREYNAEKPIESMIEMYIDSSNTLVEIIPIGNLMRIKSTHENLAGDWDIFQTWGMITIEPYESERRWICSSCVNYDNDTNNPLTPLSGLLINITYPATNIAVLECFFNPDLIDLSNGVKITAKIKDPTTFVVGGKTTSPLDDQKGESPTDDDKTLAP